MHYPRLRDLRDDSDLTQEQLVKLVGMHKTTYTNYEQGKRDIPLSIAIRLSLFYNVSLDYLAGLKPHPTKLFPSKPCKWDDSEKHTATKP